VIQVINVVALPDTSEGYRVSPVRADVAIYALGGFMLFAVAIGFFAAFERSPAGALK
jgi:hypothetical protein